MTNSAWPFALGAQEMGYRSATQATDHLWRMGEPTEGDPLGGDFYVASLRNAAKPSTTRPSAAIVVPHGFDPSKPLDVALYVHGWSNCAVTCLGATRRACSPGGELRTGSNVAGAFLEVGANAVLVAPETGAPDAKSGAPGALGSADGIDAFLDELLGSLGWLVGGQSWSAASLRRLTLTCHSGGYMIAAAAARASIAGRLPSLRELVLLDALYGMNDFENWIEGHADSLGGGPLGVRFGCVHTEGGGTRDNAFTLQRHLTRSLAPEKILSGENWQPSDYASRPVLFKASSLSHGAVAGKYPHLFFAASGFSPRG